MTSRIRLARNVAGHNFLSRCTRHQRQALEAKVRQTVLEAQVAPQTLYVDLEAAPEIVRIVVEESTRPAVRVPVSLGAKPGPAYETCPVELEVSGG